MSTISQWAVYQMCENLDNNYSYILKIVKDVYPELYSESPAHDWQRKSILGYFHKNFPKFLMKTGKKNEEENQKPFQWSNWKESRDKETTFIDLTLQIPTNWDIYKMYQTTDGNCLHVLDMIKNEYPNFTIPENSSEDNLHNEIFKNYEKLQTILDSGCEKKLNEEKEMPFAWQMNELRSSEVHSAANSCPNSPRGGSSHCLVPDLGEALYTAHVIGVVGVNNGQQISDESSKNKSKSPYSYTQLIVQAISSTTDKQLSLSGIYTYITKNYPNYMATDITWKKCLKRDLLSSQYFVKIPNSQKEPGKGSLWRIDSASESKHTARALKRKRQKGVPCSRTPSDGLSTKSSAELDSNEVKDSLKDEAAECESPTNCVSVDNLLSTSPPSPPASLHLSPTILPVSQVQTPPPTGTPPLPLLPSTEASRTSLEAAAAATSSPPSPIETLPGLSDHSECQHLLLAINKFENLIDDAIREIGEKDAKIENLKKQINNARNNHNKVFCNLKRLQHQHLRQKIDKIH